MKAKLSLLILGLGVILLTTGISGGCSQTTNQDNKSVYPWRAEISPNPCIIEVGEAQKFVPTFYDENGNAVSTPESITWGVTPESIGTMDANGVFVASAKNGEGYVYAQVITPLGIASGSTVVRITKNGILSLDLNRWYVMGDALNYVNDYASFEVYYTKGDKEQTYIAQSQATWSTSNDIAELVSPGFYHFKKDGVLTVEANYQGVSTKETIVIPKIIRITAETNVGASYRLSDSKNIFIGSSEISLPVGIDYENDLFWYSFIKFHFPQSINIPTFNLATLKMQIYYANWEELPVGWFEIYENASDWSESITAGSLPTKGTIVATPEIAGMYYKGFLNSSCEVNVTDLVRKWISGEKGNYGFRFENMKCGKTNSVSFYSRASDHEYPVIQINY